ncbi:MAG: hypothetical protein D6741_16425 [Planctomycetota bacterium]|nr:MAG: hypothetical protein D6741_16425 [Planctomycetota bacterium]
MLALCPWCGPLRRGHDEDALSATAVKQRPSHRPVSGQGRCDDVFCNDEYSVHHRWRRLGDG